MAVFNEPTQWDHELGNNADVSTLPDDTSATTGVASLQKLFQLINQTPLEAGGIAPDREDFNALFKILGDSVFYGMNGGFASYNNTYDYAVGRFVVYNNTLYKCIQANGASSTVVAPDSVSPLGSDYWAQVVTLADLSDFANKDLTNLNNTGKIAIAHNAMPSNVYDNLTLGISGSSYTAPADGFFYISKQGNVGDGLGLINQTSGFDVGSNISINSGAVALYIPAKKGDIVQVNYTALLATFGFKFIYAVGSESEQ